MKVDKVISFVALLALAAGCSDTGSSLPVSSPTAVATSPVAPSPTAEPRATATMPVPTATRTSRLATCCEGAGYCRGTGPGAGFLCSAEETAFASPYECSGESSRCALPTPTPTLTVPATVTDTPTSTPARSTPTPSPPGCHGTSACRSDELCHPQGVPFCLPGETPTVTATPLCRSDSECRTSSSTAICDQPQPADCACCFSVQCVEGCAADADCDIGDRCADHHCVVRPCVNDSDCPRDFACRNLPGHAGCSRRLCQTNDECEGGFCVGGSCYPEPGSCIHIPE